MVQKRASHDCCPTYKLIFMDINMPIMNGVDATAAIRAWETEHALPRTTIFALTAADTEKSLLRSQHAELGFDSLVGKPIFKVEFYKLLRRHFVI